MKNKQTNKINETYVYPEIHGDKRCILYGYNKLALTAEEKFGQKNTSENYSF